MKEWKTEYEYENANRVLLSHSCIVLDSIENYAHTHNVFIVFSLSPIPSNAKRIWEFLQMLSVIFVQSHWTFTKSHLMCIILSFSSIIICMNRIVHVCVCVWISHSFLATIHFQSLLVFFLLLFELLHSFTRTTNIDKRIFSKLLAKNILLTILENIFFNCCGQMMYLIFVLYVRISVHPKI